MRIDNMPLDLKVACMFMQKSWCHVALTQVHTQVFLQYIFIQCFSCEWLSSDPYRPQPSAVPHMWNNWNTLSDEGPWNGHGA